MPRLLSVLALFLIAASVRAGDWPQWLGPARNAVSPETVTPWKETPRVLWRQPATEGHSSPVVAEGKVFLHGKVKDKEEEELVARDAGTGKLLWRVSYPCGSFSSPFGSGPRATPAVVAGHIWTLGVTGMLSCFKVENGEKVWQVDTLGKLKGTNLTFGVSSSPMVVGNNVLVAIGAKGASIVAFDRNSGDILWKVLDDPASYSSPIVCEKGKQQVAIFVTSRNIVGLDPGNGRVFWKVPMVDALNESSTTPVKVDDLLVAGSVTYGSVALRLAIEQGQASATEQWKNPTLTCYFSTPISVKEQLYMVTGTFLPPIEATLRCIEVKTGKELWHKAKIGKYHAALIRTGNDKLLMLDDAGDLVLVDPSASGYQELARSHVCGQAWAHPALSDGRLYIRDEKEIICLRMTEK